MRHRVPVGKQSSCRRLRSARACAISRGAGRHRRRQGRTNSSAHRHRRPRSSRNGKPLPRRRTFWRSACLCTLLFVVRDPHKPASSRMALEGPDDLAEQPVPRIVAADGATAETTSRCPATEPVGGRQATLSMVITTAKHCDPKHVAHAADDDLRLGRVRSPCRSTPCSIQSPRRESPDFWLRRSKCFVGSSLAAAMVRMVAQKEIHRVT